MTKNIPVQIGPTIHEDQTIKSEILSKDRIFGSKKTQMVKNVITEPFPTCPFCDEWFAKIGGLRVHVSRIHPDLKEEFETYVQ